MPLHFDLRSEIGSLQEAERLELSAEDIVSLLTRFDRLGIWRIDVATGQCRLSESCRHLYGFSGKEEVHTLEAYRDRIHPDDLPVFSEAIAATIDGHSSFLVTYRVASGQGYRFVRSIGMFRDTAAGGGEVVGITHAVSEHVRQLVMTS